MRFIPYNPLSIIEEALGELSVQFNQWDLPSDLYEDNGNFILEMHLSGASPDSIDIEVSERAVRISGKREQEEGKKNKHFFQQEITYGSFERSFELPSDVVSSGTTAHLEHGVLKLILPKEKNEEPHKVEIS